MHMHVGEARYEKATDDTSDTAYQFLLVEADVNCRLDLALSQGRLLQEQPQPCGCIWRTNGQTSSRVGPPMSEDTDTCVECF